MDVKIRLTVKRTTLVNSEDWEFPDDPYYTITVAPVEVEVPVVMIFTLPVPENMSYPIALTWARTQMNNLSSKYQAVNARIDEDSLRAVYNEHRKIK